jgi:hypothetical protein
MVIRTGYSGRRGGVPSPALNSVGVVVAVPGVALQGRGWRSRRPDIMV